MIVHARFAIMLTPVWNPGAPSNAPIRLVQTGIPDHLTVWQAFDAPCAVKAIIAAKKKCSTIDSRTLADLLRCRLFSEVQLQPHELRELRRVLRYRNLIVTQTTRMKS